MHLNFLWKTFFLRNSERKSRPIIAPAFCIYNWDEKWKRFEIKKIFFLNIPFILDSKQNLIKIFSAIWRFSKSFESKMKGLGWDLQLDRIKVQLKAIYEETHKYFIRSDSETVYEKKNLLLEHLCEKNFYNQKNDENLTIFIQDKNV